MVNTKRRDFLKTIGLGTLGIGGALASGGCSSSRKDSFFVVHLTDQHVTTRRKGHLGYKACIDSINNLNPQPDLVLMGGDMAFDGLYNELEEFNSQIDEFLSKSNQLNMPWKPAIGNHDVLGLSVRRKVEATHPGIGAKYIMERIGMESPYYSFNHRRWHFVILNSIYQIEAGHGPSYEPRIGEKQLDWLRYDLGKHETMPAIVLSHYAAFNHMGQINADFDLKAMNHLVLQDNKELRHILERHGVKALLQGHTHMAENFRFNDVWYITSQAASAAWWGGNWLGFRPGYTVLELGKNEILNWKAVEFEWNHQLEPNDTVERQRIEQRQAFEVTQDSLYRAESIK